MIKPLQSQRSEDLDTDLISWHVEPSIRKSTKANLAKKLESMILWKEPWIKHRLKWICSLTDVSYDQKRPWIQYLPTVRSQGGWLATCLRIGPSSINTNSSLSRTQQLPSDALRAMVFSASILCQIFLWVSYWLVLKASWTLDEPYTPTW